VPLHEPVRQQRKVLELDRPRELEEVADAPAPTSRSAAMAGPARTTAGVDVVVEGDLLVRLDRPPGDEVGFVSLPDLVDVRVATVVHVPVGKTDKDDLPIGIAAVLGALTELLAERLLGRDFADKLDAADARPARTRGSRRRQDLRCSTA